MLTLEGRGVPTALVASDEFAPLGRAESIARGLPGLPLVTVPHPLAGNLSELVRAKASGCVDEVVQVLTQNAQELGARYEPRFQQLAERRLSQDAVCTDAVCAIDPAYR